MSVVIEVSWGELIDKISILEIKAERLIEEEALANVKRELALLTAARDRARLCLESGGKFEDGVISG